MRVAELADLTGVTVRTVRHYHALGLLPVPPVRRGVRDYDLEHVARVSRIRWLAEAGVPLATVAEVLDAEPPVQGTGRRASVLRDLRATLVALDEQLERLHAQRRRLARLVQSVEDGGPLSAMPQVAADFYARLARHATDERARRQVARERDFVELAYYRGVIPSELELLFSALDDQALQDSLTAFGRDPEAPLTDDEVEAVAAGIVERMTTRLGPDLASVAEAVGVEEVRRAYGLYVGAVSGNERRVGEAVGRRLVEVVQSLRERV